MKIKQARQMAIDEVRVEIDGLNEILPQLKKKREDVIRENLTTMTQQYWWKRTTGEIKRLSARLKSATQQYKQLLSLTNLDQYEFSDVCQPFGTPMEFIRKRRAYWVQFYLCSNAIFRIHVPVRQLFKMDKVATRSTQKQFCPKEEEVFDRNLADKFWDETRDSDNWPRRPSWNWIMKIPPCMAKYIWNDTVDPEDAVTRLTGADVWGIYRDPCKALAGLYYDSMGYKEYAYGAGYMPDGSCRIVSGDIRRKRVFCYKFTDDMNIIKPTITHDNIGNTIYANATWGKPLKLFFDSTLHGSKTMEKHWIRYHRSAWWWLRGSLKSTVALECRVDQFKTTEMRGSLLSFA